MSENYMIIFADAQEIYTFQRNDVLLIHNYYMSFIVAHEA